MKIGIGYNGSMVIIDDSGNRVLYDAKEGSEIRTAVYKYCQKKGEGVIL